MRIFTINKQECLVANQVKTERHKSLIGWKHLTPVYLLIFLLFTTNAYSELIIQGKKVVYLGNALQSGITITESEIAPTNPVLNDIWRDITDGTIYIWDGRVWTVKNTTQEIKAQIAIFKANIVNVSDTATKKCLTSLGKIIMNLYKEQ